MSVRDEDDAPGCPLPLDGYEHIVLGHGSGGRLSAELLERVILPALGRDPNEPLEDSAMITFGGGEESVAFTTDSFVIRPIFFPGGDIGELAVNGTVNDLAVAGAEPRFLSVALILEEGLPISELRTIVTSMRRAADRAGVRIVAGDTKVVDRGKGDRIFVNTTGLGVRRRSCALSVASAQPGDVVLVSGPIGDHGIAILSVREGIEFETRLHSDTAPLHALVAALLAKCPDVRCMRDPTRGGLSSTLNEIAVASRCGIEVIERDVPVRDEVRGACELLGLDPFYVANEGKLVAIVRPEDGEAALGAMRGHPLGAEARIIGRVVGDHAGRVIVRSSVGARVLSMLAGEQLPRIC